ncbi:tRNA 2-selenouridine(34) synthase MnmH [Antarcticimicrobium luteum]|uniref:tRNA 2-selenouridine(34) synthase MnmH n=1 Tax=Antarcticimicrobium luteum TaxID=2547397 RepID=A0A4R5V9G6_9RHOB|nr:tRNA 2-selenouridine(34) synthase MnmH [Antarcticimicrobium luteum]TDK48782.1 tRNA 2-selenouridine(34) synthase MnmH [Antarcticimicrobium luteum]
MAKEFHRLSDLLEHGFDTVIDVRSPAEYAEDHVPGAINLPVLDNEERARVGTIYKQDSPFRARKIGAALVFRNAAGHIETALQDKPGGWRPLVYCWRGGQRSGSFAWMLSQIGWRAESIKGGYQTYRRLVYGTLYEGRVPHRLVLLDGYTGTAKTDLLHILDRRGVQMLDLEGLAAHRGSLLGEMAEPQPSQKAFETALAVALSRLDPARPVVVEAESSKVGERMVPPALWAAMKMAPRIEVEAPLAARTAYLVRAYDDILSDPDRLRARLDGLRAHRGHAVVDGWFELIAAGDKPGLTRALMAEHYDPAYAKSRKAIGAEVLARVTCESLDGPGLEAAAAEIEAAVEGFGRGL